MKSKNSYTVVLVLYATCCIFLTSLCPLTGGAQPGNTPPTLAELYNTIKAQETNFPLPNTTETVTVAAIDLANINHAKIGFSYLIPTVWNGYYKVPNPDYDGKDNQPKTLSLPIISGVLTLANIRHLNLRFSIANWIALPDGTLSIQLGSQSKTIHQGESEIVFLDVVDTVPSLSVAFSGAIFENNAPTNIPVQVVWTGPLEISWRMLGAGAITIPVIPVSIIYAPMVDAQKKNQASSAHAISSGNSTSVSFTTQQSTSIPVPSSFQSSVDIQKDMSALGSVLSKIPNPYTMAIGAGLSVISSGLGSSVATQTVSSSVTTQHTLAVSAVGSITQTALASQGGPGVGDLLSYYYNARVIWYSDNKNMRLALLGYDGFVQTTAGQLKKALINLQHSSHGTIDPSWHLDSNSLSALLNLDPFVSNGPSSDLVPPRFVNISKGIVEIGGGTQTNTYTYTLTSSDMTTETKSTTYVENDNAGFLSFLGLGVTDTKNLQSQISQSSSAVSTNGETFTQQYIFNSNGTEHYEGEVYFDVVFGAFAFKSISSAGAQVKVSGKLYDKDGKAMAGALVKAQSGARQFVSRTDEKGNFSLRLPGLDSGPLKLYSASAEAQIDYKGAPIKNIKLKGM